jgi:hypothetical protein
MPVAPTTFRSLAICVSAEMFISLSSAISIGTPWNNL